MGRQRKTAAPAQIDLEQAIKEKTTAELKVLIARDPADLIGEYFKLDGHASAESQRFKEYLKPTVDRIELIRQALHAKAIEQKVNGFPTDEGTAYLSTIVSYKIDPDAANPETGATGRDALLDWVLAEWDTYGSEGLMLNVSKAVVDKYAQDHNGTLPPGLKSDSLTRINIKRS